MPFHIFGHRTVCSHFCICRCFRVFEVRQITYITKVTEHVKVGQGWQARGTVII